jgi:hypothetical protein
VIAYRKRTQDSVWYNFLPIMENYNIKVTREWVKRLIRKICAKNGFSRESIGIIAASRASMYFDGRWSSVSFEAVNELAKHGADMLFIEKADIIEVLSEYADKYGVALVNTIGYLTEYGKDLVQAAHRAGGHVSMISDYDLPGFHMVSKVPGLIRIGIDEETLRYFGLEKKSPLTIKYVPNLKNLQWLSAFENSVVDKEFILREKIEIDAILAQVGAERLWENIMQKLISLFPTRNYNRAISMPSIETLYPTDMQNLITRANTYISNLVSSEEQEIMEGLENVKGMIDVIEEKKKIKERLQKRVAEDEELKTIAKKADELIRTTGLSRI